nr:far upstream element-binding protein 3 [Quercus suber]
MERNTLELAAKSRNRTATSLPLPVRHVPAPSFAFSSSNSSASNDHLFPSFSSPSVKSCATMAQSQPDISQILAALGAAQSTNGTPQQQPPSQAPPPGYPQMGLPAPPQSAPPSGVGYLPPPSTTGSVDLSAIKPVNSGSVSIAEAIAKARSIAADRGVSSYDARSAPRKDPRLADRDYQRSRSRSPPRRESYNDNPYRDERREDSRRGNHRRSPSPDRNVRGSRDPQQSYRQNESEVETIHVKSALVGLIIGRNGENLRRVESESGARVQFIQAKDSRAVERQCTITGTTRAREDAKSAIFSIIDDGQGPSSTNPDKGGYTAGMPGRAKVNLPALREGEASSQIMVPDKTVGLIIGRGGETIKDLQERSGCHVNIVGENKSQNGLRPVNLIGSQEATAKAKQLILEIVESDSRGSGSNAQPASRDRGFQDPYAARGGASVATGGNSIDKTIHVPSEAVGMIIGKGGETIKDMQKTTGCKINVNQPQRPDVTRQIDLSGTPSAMADAERIIWEKVETVQQRDAAGGGRGRGAGGRNDQGGNNGYSQQQTSSGYGGGYGGQQYASPAQSQAPPQMPAFQMPAATPATAQPASDQSATDPYAAYGGQAAWYAHWYAQQMAQFQQQGANQGVISDCMSDAATINPGIALQCASGAAIAHRHRSLHRDSTELRWSSDILSPLLINGCASGFFRRQSEAHLPSSCWALSSPPKQTSRTLTMM